MLVFVQSFVAWTRRRPLLALLGSGLVGWLVYWQLTPAPPVLRSPMVKAQAVPGLGAERAVMEKTLLDVQKENAQLKGSLQEQQRALTQLQQTLTAAERERQTAQAAQEQRFEDLLRRAQMQQAQQARHVVAATPAPKPAPKPAPAAPTPTPSPGEGMPRADQGAKVRILRAKEPASFAGAPPSVTRADTPFLPAGSYAEGRLVTGVFATSRVGGALPVLFAVTKPFQGPFELQGPGRSPMATALPIAGCLILGRAQADLASSRVIMQLDTLSCVMPDGATFERAIKGYAVGVDGTLGVVGRLETRDSAYIARAFLTSLMAGAADAFALAKRTVVVTPFGGSQSTITGNVGETAGYSALGHAAAQLSQFYLSQAERLMPVLWAESGSQARLILQEGLALDGLPTVTTLSSRGLP
jgi:conjugal transfer pilus assembly protein TraB